MPKLILHGRAAFLRESPDDSVCTCRTGTLGILEVWESVSKKPGKKGAVFYYPLKSDVDGGIKTEKILKTSLTYDMAENEGVIYFVREDRRYSFELTYVLYSWTADGIPERCSVSRTKCHGENCYHCGIPIDGEAVRLCSADGSVYILHRKCAYDGCGRFDRGAIDAALCQKR